MKRLIPVILLQLIYISATSQFSDLNLLYPNTVNSFAFNSMALGDMDSDGDLDVASLVNNTIYVGINNNGQFGEIVSWNISGTSSRQRQQILCRDIDSDGDTDLLTTKFWIRNDQGSFSLATHYINANTELTTLKVGNLDGNEFLDLYSDYYEIGGNIAGGGVLTSMVLLNPGNAAIDAAVPVVLDENASVGRNMLGDLNGDGVDEIIVRFGFPVAQKVYSLAGNTLQYLWEFSVPTEGFSFADMNADGFDDIVCAGLNYNSNTYFAVGINSSNQSFDMIYADQPGGGAATYTAEYFGELPLVDYDGDGDLDFIGVDFNNGKKWIRNNGGTAFEFMGDVVYNGFNQSSINVLIGNLDNDPEAEMVEGYTGFVIMEQYESGYMRPDQTIMGNVFGSDVKTIVSCDINQDGARDIICSNKWGIFYHPVINGIAGPSELLVTGFEPGFIEAKDLNGDGWIDLIVEEATSIFVYPGTGVGEFGKRIFLQTTGVSNDFGSIADINLDGQFELIYTGYSAGHAIYYKSINADWTLGAASTLLAPGNAYGALKSGGLQMGDVNGDGLLDVILTNGASLMVYLRNSDGSLQQINLATTGTDRFSLVDRALQDVDGDGVVDITYCINKSSISRSEFGYYSFNGTSFVNHSSLSQVQSGLYNRPDFYAAFIDVNEDDVLDVIGLSASGVELYQNDGNGNFNYTTTITLAASGNLLIQLFLEDIDLNGTYDLIIRNRTDALDYSAYAYVSTNLNDSPFRFTAVVFLDSNQNGLFDQGESAMPNQAIVINDQTYFTPANGTVIAGYDGGEINYAVNTNTDLWIYSTPVSGSEFLDVQNPVATSFIGLYPNGDVYASDVNVVAITGMCLFDSQHYLFISNEGNMPISGGLTYSVDSSYTNLSALDNGQQISEYVFHWDFENLMPGGTTYRRLSMTNPFELDTLAVLSNTHTVQLFNQNGDPVGQDDGLFEQAIACAFDPNYKEEHNGWSELGYIENGDELRYTIHFQNTGNAPAETVRLTDQLSEFIDRSTVQPIGASHAYTMSMDENGLITVLFENINLPDSVSDPLGSMGFVTFKVSPNGNLPYNTSIENTAQIYFDFNEPIVTNTTVNTILDCESHAIEMPELICEGTAVSFVSSRSEFVEYQWVLDGMTQFSGASINIDNLNSGAHTLAIVVGNPVCSIADQVEFMVSPQLQWTALSEELHSCGDPIELSAQLNSDATTSFYWNENVVANETTYSATESGSYMLVASNECGSISHIWEVAFHAPTVDVIISMDSLWFIATPGFVEYQWVFNGGSPIITTTNAVEYIYLDGVTVDLIVVDEFGCTAQVYASWTGVVDNTLSTSIFPNPTTGAITIQNAPLNALIEVFDVSGKMLIRERVISSAHQLELSSLPNGVYHLKMIDGDKMQQCKVVKVD